MILEDEAFQLQELMLDGRAELLEVVEAIIPALNERDAAVRAWASRSDEGLREQARRLASRRLEGHEPGSLFGLMAAVKDIFDTADLSTGWGLEAMADVQASQDAEVVRRLRAAGALLPGKAVTTPLASGLPAMTDHPLFPGHTPGASSAGSAAAVASGMAAFGVGTQTRGSVIRPASFCGVIGYKPSAGLIPRTGCLLQSPTLDQVGVFARSLRMAARVVDALVGDDGQDSASAKAYRPGLEAALHQPSDFTPRFALVRSPYEAALHPEMQASLDALQEFLGDQLEPVTYDSLVVKGMEWHETIHLAEMAHAYSPLQARLESGFPEGLSEALERGRSITATRYLDALAQRRRSQSSFDDTFFDFDVILTPSSLGPAPEGHQDTGDAAPCLLWSLLGFPVISLPLLSTDQGLPMGIQLVAAPGHDRRLLRTAAWLIQAVDQS